MVQQLSLSARPRTLDGLVGFEKTTKRIRGHMASGRVVKAWLFYGPKGVGKTTLAKILAISYQCEHQKVFGNPCPECRRNWRSFDIYPINCAKITGIRELEQSLDGASYAPRSGKYRVYILDEVQNLTQNAQSLALKYLEEDSAETTIFILATTAPHLLIETLQSRCTVYRLKELEEDDIAKLVKKLLLKTGSDKPADRLAMELAEHGIGSGRLIAQAVEKYVAGASAEEACDVEAAAAVDTRALTRALVRGDWAGTAKFLEGAQLADAPAIRLGTLSYMRKMLLHSPEVGDSAAAWARAIEELVSVQRAENSVIHAALTAALYRACAYYAKFKG